MTLCSERSSSQCSLLTASLPVEQLNPTKKRRKAEEDSEQLINQEQLFFCWVQQETVGACEWSSEAVLTLYGCCRWLIGQEGKISSVGGLAARYAAAAYIQMELKALSIALSHERLQKCRQRKEREVRRGKLWDHTGYAAAPKLHVVRAHGCVWQGKSQSMFCLSMWCCGGSWAKTEAFLVGG